MIHKMGHDITATQNDEQVAYLRRSMASCAVHHLYQVLDCLDNILTRSNEFAPIKIAFM